MFLKVNTSTNKETKFALTSKKRTLLPGQIDVWYTSLHTHWKHDKWKYYQTLLSVEEKKQQHRFIRIEDRQNYLVSRVYLRHTLSQYLKEISSKDLVFEKGFYGKPFISNALEIPLQFNVSHTQNTIAIAVVLEDHIGIDVESTVREVDALNIAKSFFAPLEYEQLLNLPLDQVTSKFIKIWTLKESYIKACGTGLSTPLDEFYFSFANGKIKISFNDPTILKSSQLSFYSLNVNENNRIALALKSNQKKTYQISVRESISLSTNREVVSSRSGALKTNHIN